MYADFHFHSKYSRAVSPQMTLEGLNEGARTKGLGLIGTGDFSHPAWFKELKEKLESQGNGFYKLKTMPESQILYTLTNEVATFWSTPQGQRNVHHVIHAPSLEVVEQLNEVFSKWGNLAADGRPMFARTTGAKLVEACMGVSKDILVYPAHAWTPYFGVLGSKSGYDVVEDCYEDQSKHIYALETGMSCYDPETEVLTRDGWKRVADVGKSDLVCTLDSKTEKIVYQKPLNLFSYSYVGKMYRVKTKRVDLLVTPNHKLLYAPCDFRNKPKLSLKKAEDLFGKSKRFKKDGIWAGSSPDTFVLPGLTMRHGSRHYSGTRYKQPKNVPIIPWLKFFGFWIAEGWTTNEKNGRYNIYLANSDATLLGEFELILQEFGYHVYKYLNRGILVLRVSDCQLYTYLKQFGKASEKHVPVDVKSLSKELLQIFLDYYIKGDGHKYGRSGKGLSATTSSMRLRDDLQEIALKLGISAYYKLGRKKGTPITSLPCARGSRYLQAHDTWVVYFIRKNLHAVLPSTIKKGAASESWVDYAGQVYCLEVPNHVLYVRRNGIPVWCGNSDPAMNWRYSKLDRYTLLSNSDSHSNHPWRLGRECNAFNLTQPSYKEVFETIRTGDASKLVYTLETDPGYGKYHYDGHRGCKYSCGPAKTRELKGICPICRKPLTIGVESRVEELADRPVGATRKNAIPFKKILPLHELVSASMGVGLQSKAVSREGDKLIARFGTELGVLLDISEEELRKETLPKIADAVMLNRTGSINVKPGFDGEYGVLQLNGAATEDEPVQAQPNGQKTLGEY
ncbi:hypothetical protein AUJ14_05845 [Candidatus Micrarchaeota archaeon CG1_02_55_22]|nr:MAG: hypothetical protein AUJ14_05845 [Candidatus Micrarchaeota archaeon CG1_02_55_22]